MRDSNVRIGVIGLDHWYSAISFAEQVAGGEGTELAGVADANLGRARQVAERAGVPGLATADLQALIDDPSVDAIASFISVDRNPEICIAAARQGKHLLSIKPVALTLEAASAVRAAVCGAGVAFLPAESRSRLSPHNQQLKAWLEEGRFGRIMTAFFSLWSRLPRGWPDDGDPGWFADPARTPGGGWIDHSIYQIDQLRWLLGEEVVSVAGEKANYKYPDLGLEDYGIATVRFEGGAIATIEDTWHAPLGSFRTASSLVGTEGALLLDSTTGKATVSGKFPPFTGWVQIPPPAAHVDGVDHFAALVRGEAEPVATIDDAWRNLAACLAFYEAAGTGRAVAPARLP